MEHQPIDHSQTTIRLFKSNILEYFTHIHPIVIVIIWLPVVIYFFIEGITQNEGKLQLINILGFLIGLFI